jgi:hypothetical protein
MQSMQSGFMSMLSPFLKTGTAMQKNIGSVGQKLKSLDELEVENGQLVSENTVPLDITATIKRRITLPRFVLNMTILDFDN